MILKKIWKPKNFYSIISALACLPIAFSFEYISGFFLVANLFLLINFNNIYLDILNHYNNPIIKIFRPIAIIILPIINFFIALTMGFLISWLFSVSQEGNVFAFTLIFIFIPYCVFYLVAVFRYFFFLSSLNIEIKDEKKQPKDIKVDKRGQTLEISINDKIDIDFEYLKQKLSEQFSTNGYTNTVINKKESWMIKNEDANSYIQLVYKDLNFVIEIFNMKEVFNEIRPLLNHIRSLDKK